MSRKHSTTTEPEAWQTPVDIPEIGALAGDWIVPSCRHPNRAHIVRELPENVVERLRCHLSRLQDLCGVLPPDEPDEHKSRLRLV